jgi:hypothetical protein
MSASPVIPRDPTNDRRPNLKAASNFPDFSPTAVPSDHAPLLVHPHVTKMLWEGKFVLLDYFSIEARRRATKAVEAGELEFGAGPGMGCSSPDPQVRPDVKLTWDEIQYCSTAMITHMVEAGYPQRITDALGRMYSQLNSFKFITYRSHEFLGDNVLIRYVADTRLEFYALKDSGRALFDIGKISPSKLNAIKSDLFDALRDEQVRQLPLYNECLANETFFTFPLLPYPFPCPRIRTSTRILSSLPHTRATHIYRSRGAFHPCALIHYITAAPISSRSWRSCIA